MAETIVEDGRVKCPGTIEKGGLAGKKCLQALLIKDPKLGWGIPCDRSPDFHPLRRILRDLVESGELDKKEVLAAISKQKERRKKKMAKVRVVESPKDVREREHIKFIQQIRPIIKEYGWHLSYGDTVIVVRWASEKYRQSTIPPHNVEACIGLNYEEKFVTLCFHTGEMLGSEMLQARRIFDQLVGAAHKISDKTGYEVEVQAPGYVLKIKLTQ